MVEVGFGLIRMFLDVRCSHLHLCPYLNTYISGHSKLLLTDECSFCT